MVAGTTSAPNQRRVDENGERQAHAEHLDDRHRSEDLGAEDHHHDRRCSRDEATGLLKAVCNGQRVVTRALPFFMDA